MIKRLAMTWCVSYYGPLKQIGRFLLNPRPSGTAQVLSRFTSTVEGSLCKVHPDYHHLRIQPMPHLRGDSNGVASDGCPPDHQVGVESDPNDRPKESDWEELSRCKKTIVRSTLLMRVKNLCTCVCCNFIVRTKAALKVHVKLEQNILDGSVS